MKWNTTGTTNAEDEAIADFLHNVQQAPPVSTGGKRLSVAQAEYREMLRGVRKAMTKLISQGKSRDEVIAAKPTAPWDENPLAYL